MCNLRRGLKRILLKLGAIGAFQSRSQVTIANLSASRSAFAEAASRIEDVDVVDETANLIRLKVLQDAGVAILAQANLMPQLLLDLLKNE
jgi:flagellin